MTNEELLDLYSDYLISSFGQTTATGLTALLGGSISHDRIQRFLAGDKRSSADLWQIVKPHVRAMQSDEGVMIVDDSVAEKPYTDKKDGKYKRRSPVGKNEYYRTLLQQAAMNQISFKYVLDDIWYGSAENMNFVKRTLHKGFVMPVKANRKVALSLADKQQGRYVRVDRLMLEPNAVRKVHLQGVDFALLLVKQVFVNEDASTGVMYLVTSDTTQSYDDMVCVYRKRWNVEPYHKSLEQNASLEKSPTRTVVTQTNHLFAALCSYIKLELLRVTTKLNHFALKSKLYTRALQVAFGALRELQPTRLAA